MANVNQLIIIGRIVRDIELKNLPGGTVIAESSVVTNRKFTTASGEKREESVFMDFKVWGKQAEVIAQYAGKGSSIYLQGRVSQDSWEDKATGAKRSKLSMTVENFQFLDSKSDDGGGDRQQPSRPRQGSRPAQGQRRDELPDRDQPFNDSDVPF